MARIANALWQFMVITHRYLGVAVGLLMAMWFVSGMIMMYVDLSSSRRRSAGANAAGSARKNAGGMLTGMNTAGFAPMVCQRCQQACEQVLGSIH
jgi:hypothetical protein